jgi:hypothetical protein
MFAVIGKKIFDKLNDSYDFNVANNTLSAELVPNGTFPVIIEIDDWTTTAGAPRFISWRGTLPYAIKFITQGVSGAATQTQISITSGKTYICTYDYESDFGVRVDIGTTVLGDTASNDVYEGVDQAVGTATVEFLFTSNYTGDAYLTITNLSTDSSSEGWLSNISVKEVNNKVFPVIIPQGTSYPATTFEIANVDNFITKSSSLASCDVSLRIACFADNYNTTYNQSKAVVEALDYYSVTYTEDGVSYTAKFRFVSLDDDYYKLPEKFYKNLIFNCLITKN